MHKRTRAQHLQRVEQIAEKAAQLLCAADVDINDKVKIALADTVFFEPVEAKRHGAIAQSYINPNRADLQKSNPNLPAQTIQEMRLYLLFVSYLFLYLLEEDEQTGELAPAFDHAQNFIGSLDVDFGAFEDIDKFKDHVLGCLFEPFNLGRKSIAQYNREQRECADADGVIKYAFWCNGEVWQFAYSQVSQREDYPRAFPRPLYPKPFYFLSGSQKTTIKKNKKNKQN